MTKKKPRRQGLGRVARRILLLCYGIVVLLPIALIAIYEWLPPPITPLMVIRAAEGEGLERDWVNPKTIAATAPQAVIAAEDNLFCSHIGFDWNALGEAFDAASAGKAGRGGSTISQQTAKNLLLWPERSYVRKGLEAYLTALLEIMLDKERILTLYLNIAEWGPGIYGIEAAAQHHFGKPAAKLTKREAARLAAILPDPRGRSAARPGPHTDRYSNTIRRRMGQIAEHYECLERA